MESNNVLDLDKIVSDIQDYSNQLQSLLKTMDIPNIVNTCGCISHCIGDLLEAMTYSLIK